MVQALNSRGWPTSLTGIKGPVLFHCDAHLNPTAFRLNTSSATHENKVLMVSGVPTTMTVRRNAIFTCGRTDAAG